MHEETGTDTPSPDVPPRVKRMRLRYAGTCVECATPLAAQTVADYDRIERVVRCVRCPAPALGDTPDAEPQPLPYVEGIAGASARREFERRREAREARVRANHPLLGAAILAMRDDPMSTRVWSRGAVGESAVARVLDSRAGERVRVLHDRRIRGTVANIDHLVVAPSGVYVVDTKRYTGRPERRVLGPPWRMRSELYVDGRRRTPLVESVIKQVWRVSESLGQPELPVHGVLCFVDADFPLLGNAFTVRGIHVLWPGRLRKLVARAGPLPAHAVEELHLRLREAFPGQA